jgi:hypothetical protein
MKRVTRPVLWSLILLSLVVVVVGIVLARRPRVDWYISLVEDPETAATAAKAAAAKSDLVVVGTFHLGWPLPWFDGWHYRPALQVKEVLAGSKGIQSISFRWKRPFGVTRVLCNDMQDLDRRSGVWFLENGSGAWKLVGHRTDFCPDPFLAPESQAIKNAVWHAKSP